MKVTKIISITLAAIMLFLSVPVFSSNTKDIEFIEATNNYINGGLDSFGLSDYHYSFEKFNDDLDGSKEYASLSAVAHLLSDGELTFVPETEDYMEAISNMLAISESENPNDISEQKQLDHLKDGADYVSDAIDTCVDAYSLIGGLANNETVSFISDVIETIDSACDTTEDAVKLISNLETATEQYVRYDKILQSIEENSEGSLKDAAAIMRNSLNSYYNYALGEYCDLAAEGLFDRGATIFDFAVDDLVKTLPAEEKKFFENIERLNLLKDAYKLGSDGALFLGNVILNTEDMTKRIKEIYAHSVLSDALEETVINEKERFIFAYDKGEATRELCDNYLNAVDYLYSNRRRGEYCLYSLMKEDMGVLSWLADDNQVDEWYNKFLKFMTERDLLLEKVYYDMDTFQGHTYMVLDGEANTWEEAEAYCRSLGGHLATISNSDENKHVFELMKSAGYNSAYIGLRETSEGVWVWCNGEPVAYTNWGGTEPNNERGDECYGMFYYKFSDGSWNDGDFDDTVGGGKAFICEWD